MKRTSLQRKLNCVGIKMAPGWDYGCKFCFATGNQQPTSTSKNICLFRAHDALIYVPPQE